MDYRERLRHGMSIPMGEVKVALFENYLLQGETEQVAYSMVEQSYNAIAAALPKLSLRSFTLADGWESGSGY